MAEVLRASDDHYCNALQTAEQEYGLAKQHFQELMNSGPVWCPKYQERFRAASDRQGEARERYLKAMGA
jgi:hypothetical protein